MNGIFEELRDLGMGIDKIANMDDKGRITIPAKIRKQNKFLKYYLCTYKDIMVLKGVD